MTTKSRGDGTKLEYTVAGSAVTSDTVELVQDSLGFHTIDAAIGETAVLALTGEFDCPAATGQAWTAGENLYWDDTAKVFTTTATANTLRGKAAADKGSAAAVGIVNLYPGLA